MSGRIVVVGLGPAGLARVPDSALQWLQAPDHAVIVRTLHHPAAAELAEQREVVSCDDLYETADDFEDVYRAIEERVLEQAAAGPVVYAVPGSSAVGERAARAIVTAGRDAGYQVVELPGESFLDLALLRTGVDPITAGLQIVDARSLPDPLPLHLPTLITQVDRSVVLAELTASLSRILGPETELVWLDALGDPNETVVTTTLGAVTAFEPTARTSLFLPPQQVGWLGLVETNRELRIACPWDREQTHHTLVSHLIEETYETVEAVSRLGSEAPGGEPDYGAYAELEEELGDLLLQVVFHATLAAEAGAFDVEEIAEGIRRKLVARHPHVFGEVEAATAAEVKHNWERLKDQEKARESLMDDIPAAMPAIARADKMQRRAASVGFDWTEAEAVLAQLTEETGELAAALHADSDDAGRAVDEELGDVLFTVVNLARHLGVDAEMALRSAADKFAARFRHVEAAAAGMGRDLDTLSAGEMDDLWRAAKAASLPATKLGQRPGA